MSKYLIKEVSITAHGWQRGRAERERSCLSWFERAGLSSTGSCRKPSWLCLGAQWAALCAWGGQITVCALGDASGSGQWLLVQQMRMASRHTLQQTAQTSHTPPSEMGEGFQVPAPVLFMSFSFPVHRHLEYPPANLEKISSQGTDIQSEDNGSLAAKRWLRVSSTCDSDIFINSLSDILNAKQGMGAKRARITCRRSLGLYKANPQDMCPLKQQDLEEQPEFTKKLFLFLVL